MYLWLERRGGEVIFLLWDHLVSKWPLFLHFVYYVFFYVFVCSVNICLWRGGGELILLFTLYFLVSDTEMSMEGRRSLVYTCVIPSIFFCHVLAED